jgi:hypothetical protein
VTFKDLQKLVQSQQSDPEQSQLFLRLRDKSFWMHVLQIGEAATDPKTKLQARAIANDCYKFIMEMSTNAGIVSDALKFVNQSEKKIDSMQSVIEEESAEETETTTTSGVY